MLPVKQFGIESSPGDLEPTAGGRVAGEEAIGPAGHSGLSHCFDRPWAQFTVVSGLVTKPGKLVQVAECLGVQRLFEAVGGQRLRNNLVIRFAVGVRQAVSNSPTDRELDRLVIKIAGIRTASHQSSVDVPQNKVHHSIVPESQASRILAMPDVLVVVHDVDDNLNELAVPLAEAGLRLVTWDAQNDFEHAPTVDDLARYSGLISLGAHAGVDDEVKHPWMQLERTLIERALETELPFLGLCFGAQLLASVAGGAFIPSPVPELGWTRVRMTAEAATDPVLGMIGGGLEAGDRMADGFHFHYDSYRLPEKATLLGETDGIIQAFRVGTSAWATQFHLEVGLNQQLAWLTTYRRAFEKEGVDIEHEVDQSHALWRSYRDQAHRVGAAFAVQVNAFAQRQVH